MLFKRMLISIPAIGILMWIGSALLSLFFESTFEFGRWFDHLRSPWVLHVLNLTVSTAALGLLFSWIGAWIVLIIGKGRGGSFLRLFSIMPGMVFALLVLFALRAFRIQEPYSMRSVLIAWTLGGVCYLAFGISEGVKDLGSAGKEELRVLGANPIQVFWNHEFRRTLGLQTSLLIQQFWFFLTSFSLVMILGGGPPSETLEVAIYSSVRLGNLDYSKALAFAFVQTLLVLGIKMASWSVERRFGAGPSLSETFQGVKKRSLSVGFRGSFIAVGVLFGIFWPGMDSFQEFLLPLFITVMLGVSVVALTLVFSLSSYFSGMRTLSEMGAWVSPILISLAIWNLSGRTLPSIVNAALIQALFFAPWFSRVVFPLLDRVRIRELEAARVLGAGKVRAFFEVEWPRIRGTIFRMMGMVFALSATEVTSVLLFSRGDFDTVSSYCQNLFSRFRIEEAAFGVILMLGLAAAALAVSEDRRQV